MKYTFLLYTNEAAIRDRSPEQSATVIGAHKAYTAALSEAGVLVAMEWLKPSLTATMLTNVDGKVRTVDGPYAETKEQLGGFYSVDVADLDAAIAWAARCPTAMYGGKVEIRPAHPH